MKYNKKQLEFDFMEFWSGEGYKYWNPLPVPVSTLIYVGKIYDKNQLEFDF